MDAASGVGVGVERSATPTMPTVGGAESQAASARDTAVTRSRSRRAADSPGTVAARVFCSLCLRESLEVLGELVQVHDVRILVVHVEEVDLVRQLGAVVDALLGDDDVEAVGVGVGD